MTVAAALRAPAAGLILLLALSAPARADPASEAMVRDFVAWLDASPDWSASVRAVRSARRDTILEGLSIGRDDPRITISVETLRLHDLETRPGGGFRFSEAEMTGGAVAGEAMSARIPSATAEDVAMPNLADAPLDPKHLMSSIARLYARVAEGTLGELHVPDLSVTQSHTDADGGVVEARATYRDILLRDLSDGILARQEAGPIAVESTAPDGSELAFTIEKAEADRLDLAAMAHVFDEAQYRDGKGDGVWRPLLSRVLYRGLDVSGPEGARVRVKEAAAEGLDARQPDEPFTDAWNELLDPQGPAEGTTDLALAALLQLGDAFRMGTARIDGLSADAPDGGGRLALASITLSGLSSAGVDSFITSGLSLDSPEAFLTLAKLELAGFVSPDIRALMGFAAIEKGEDPQRHAEDIARSFAALPRLSHFGLEGLVAGPSEAEAVSLARLSLDFGDWNHIFAESSDLQLETLHVPRSLLRLDPKAERLYDALGYGDLTLGLSFSDRWSPAAGTDAGALGVEVKDAGRLDLGYTLTGLTIDWLERATAEAAKGKDGEAALDAMLADLRLADATLAVTDRSLLDRTLGIVAKQQGLDIDGAAYRQQMRAALPFLISAFVPAELAQRFAPPIQEFMEGGRTLFADVAPPSPLPLVDLAKELADPLALPDRLNLKLRTEPTKE